MPRWCVIALVLVGGIACGGTASPTVPTEPASIAGAWVGTFQIVRAAATSAVPVRLTLSQTGASVGGTWGAETPDGSLPMTDDQGNLYGLHGFMTGTVAETTFSGRLGFYDTASSGHCNGVIEVAGSASAAGLNWVSSRVIASCTRGVIAPTSVAITLQPL
jgi:hypothetical protein